MGSRKKGADRRGDAVDCVALSNGELPTCVLARLARPAGPLQKSRLRRRAQRVAEGDQDEISRRRIEDERSLLEGLATGDERALETLFIAHAGRLHRVAYQYLRSSWAARAVVQDVFTALWTRRASITVRGPLGAYLTAAVRNRAQSVLRDEVRRRERDTRWAESTGKESRDAGSAGGPRDGADLTTGIAALDAKLRSGADVRAMVKLALAELPERQRTVFRLRVEQHMSNLEVQNAIEAVSVKAVERLFARAVKTLRARLLTDAGSVAPTADDGATASPITSVLPPERSS